MALCWTGLQMVTTNHSIIIHAANQLNTPSTITILVDTKVGTPSCITWKRNPDRPKSTQFMVFERYKTAKTTSSCRLLEANVMKQQQKRHVCIISGFKSLQLAYVSYIPGGARSPLHPPCKHQYLLRMAILYFSIFRIHALLKHAAFKACCAWCWVDLPPVSEGISFTNCLLRAFQGLQFISNDDIYVGNILDLMSSTHTLTERNVRWRFGWVGKMQEEMQHLLSHFESNSPQNSSLCPAKDHCVDLIDLFLLGLFQLHVFQAVMRSDKSTKLMTDMFPMISLTHTHQNCQQKWYCICEYR